MAYAPPNFPPGLRRHDHVPGFSEYWNELEPSVLIVAGFALFVFPEPATSALGAGLMLFGVAWWFYEWGR